MVSEETKAYMNTALQVMLFSLLMVGMSIRFSEYAVLNSWADARSFANAMSTRPYTSADCFAYETAVIKYDPDTQEVITERRVFPSVIDIRKYTEDRYFDCIQNYFFGEISHIQGLTGVTSESAFFIDFELIDHTDPLAIRQFGNSELSTREQLDFAERAEYIEGVRRTIEQTAATWDLLSFGLDIGLSIILATVTAGTVVPDIDYVFRATPVTDVTHVDQNLINLVEEYSTVYSTSAPVIIRYSDDNGEFLYDHVGELKMTIHYMIA